MTICILGRIDGEQGRDVWMAVRNVELILHGARFSEVLTAASVDMAVFWNVESCSLVESTDVSEIILSSLMAIKN